MNCQVCGAALLLNARFCTVCGAAISPLAVNPAAPIRTSLTPAVIQNVSREKVDTDALELVNNYLVWNLHPGQVARILTPRVIDTFSGARGVAVHNGTRAIVFINGAAVADLKDGLFDFSQQNITKAKTIQEAEQKRSKIMSFVTAGATLASKLLQITPREPSSHNTSIDEKTELQDKTSTSMTTSAALISVLLVREGPLPVILTLHQIATSTVVCNAVIQVMVEIIDPLAFHRSLLQVRRELGLNTLSMAISPIVESALRQELKGVKAEDIAPDPDLEHRLTVAMASALSAEWGFLRVVRIVKISTHRNEIERLQKFRDVTYFSDQALEQISARNEFANRLHLERNRQRIQEASTEQHLHSELLEINRDDLVSKDELKKFELLLDHDRRIREATTEQQYQDALNGMRKSELIREDSLDLLEREMQERRQDHSHRRLQALDLFDLSRILETDQARLQWELDVGDQRIALEMNRKMREYISRYRLAELSQHEQRLKDEYQDERQRKADMHDDERRTTQATREHQQRLSLFESAKQAQALSEERLRDAHAREVASDVQRAKDERDAELVNAQRWVGMTPEQIMAANPNLSSAAAASLAAKYTAEDNRLHSSDSIKDELRNFMTLQLSALQDLMHHSLDSNAKAVGATSGISKHAVIPETTNASAAQHGNAVSVSPSFCNFCGQRLTTTVCPQCPPASS